MNCVLKTGMALTVLCLSPLIVGGCNNSSGTASVAATLTLKGSYIASGNGQSIALLFDNSGCMFGDSASFNSASRVTSANWILNGAQYSMVGTTVRVTGGTMTDYGQIWEAANGGSSGGGNTILLTLANSGQSLDMTTHSGQVVEFIKQ